MVTVFVSGATGFIAQQTIKQLLDKGYSVVGSVRSSEKGDVLSKAYATSNFTYEIVPDLVAKGAFDEALKKHPEVTIFLHTALPVQFKVEDVERDLLNPAVEGTVNALSAIHKYGPQIKSVVVTSSFAAVKTSDTDTSIILSEDTWNNVTKEEALKNPSKGYPCSKTLAEKAVWKFIEDNDVNFNLNVVNPSYVFGPQTIDAYVKNELNLSCEIVNSFLKGEEPGTFGRFIDVRDVARVHIAAFENPNIKNQRLLVIEDDFTPETILKILHDNFPQLKDKIRNPDPIKEEKIRAGFNQVDNSKTRKLLGFKFISLEKSIVDSVEQLLSVLS